MVSDGCGEAVKQGSARVQTHGARAIFTGMSQSFVYLRINSGSSETSITDSGNISRLDADMTTARPRRGGKRTTIKSFEGSIAE